MSEIARLTTDSELFLTGELNEVLPVITDGLVHHFPCDGRGGLVDIISGHYADKGAVSNVNLFEAVLKDWRDPANWEVTGGTVVWDDAEDALKITGNTAAFFSQLFYIDTTKLWFIEATIKNNATGDGKLYFGGESKDISKNDLPGKPGTYDYFGGKTLTITSAYQTIKNVNIAGAPRTGEDTVLTTTDTWYTGTKYFQPLFLANYGCTVESITWIKDLKFYYTDPDLSGCTMGEDGISCEEAVTNICPTPLDFSAFVSYSNGYDGVIYDPEIGKNVLNISNKQSWCGVLCSNIILPNGPGTYTLSVKTKIKYSSKPGVIKASLYTTGGGLGDTETYTTIENSVVTLTMTRTYTTNIINLLLLCYGGVNDADHIISAIFFEPQIEFRSFRTKFTPSSRVVGDLKFPGVLQRSKGTVVADIIIHEDNIINGLHGNDQYTMNNTAAWNGANFFCFHDTSKFLINGANNNQMAKTTQIPLIREQRAQLALVYDDSNGTMLVYINGVLATTNDLVPGLVGQLGALVQDWSHSGVNTSTNYKMCQTLYGLSFYNRPLTATEISALYKNKFEFLNDGTLHVDNLNELINLPAGCIHFPLNGDKKDITKTRELDNLAVENYFDGGCYVGPAASNVYTNPNFKTDLAGWIFWGFDGYIASRVWLSSKYFSFNNRLNKNDLHDGCVKITVNPASPHPYLIYQIPSITVPTKRSLRVILCMSDGSKVDESKVYPSWNGRDGGAILNIWTSIRKIPGTFFYECIVDNISQTGGVGAYDDLIGMNINPGFTVYVSFMQVQDYQYFAPMVSASQSASRLKFNLMQRFGLKWNGEFTIMYKKTPYTQGTTGYHLDSLGRSPNTLGGGYAFWGKTSGSDDLAVSISNYISTPINIVDYMYKPQWNILKKSGNILTIMILLSNGVVLINTKDLNGVPDNYFLNENGYDLELSEWNEGNQCGAIYNDFIISPTRCLTDDEINSIIKQDLRITTDGTLFVSNVIEGEVL